jgi:hypothetical protein
MTYDNKPTNKIITSKELPKLEAIIFDMDGVLVNSV